MKKQKSSAVNGISYNRHMLISKYLDEHQSGTIEDFCELLGISAPTVRRELNKMDSLGMIARVYGGAIAKKPILENEHVMTEQTFSSKQESNVEEKKRIARAAVKLIPDNATIFVNSGTTTFYFINALKSKAVSIITNNADSISIDNDIAASILYLGGTYRYQSRSFIGPMAMSSVEGIHSTLTVLGTNGFSPDRGLTSTILQECAINQKMVANTLGKVIVLADHSKIGVISNFVSVPLSDVDILVTDMPLNEEITATLQQYNIEVIVAEE